MLHHTLWGDRQLRTQVHSKMIHVESLARLLNAIDSLCKVSHCSKVITQFTGCSA